MQGLKITIHTISPVVTLSGRPVLHMDSILSYAQVMPEISGIPGKNDDLMIIQVDGVMKVWESGEGRPLYAVSDLYPIGDTAAFTEYANKKFPAEMLDFSKKTTANLVAGRYKEQRKPLNTIFCDKWEAIAIGDKDKITSLLERISNIGSRSNCGFGRIEAVDVIEDDSVTLEKVLTHRNVPAQMGGGDISRPISFGGWTPPYWHSPFHELIIEGEENALF